MGPLRLRQHQGGWQGTTDSMLKGRSLKGGSAAALCCVDSQCKAHLDVALEVSRRPLKLGLEVVFQQEASGLPYLLPSQHVSQPVAMQKAAAGPGLPNLETRIRAVQAAASREAGCLCAF